ncbi:MULTISPECIES: oligopeptide ABC transporter substrate-binding protein [unclassified Parvimonas]|uniref:oligopeptide ABC transporter substrate-binding protein n=1 Tax=unclassified Parvimonas TaxID=1151464 RepID=UPI002B4840A6|nr:MULTISPECIES: oligopeptide ABC transporter substrate-binding protein [unclassified Parvimonas]MEB3025605.1 oligopeptide ABC transporter substrate-binding protein [Parvimonas sp. M13]MEB3089741.1 oligopeptide ABC transporter substrate-binding protein [Parvimonas sp. M20]
MKKLSKIIALYLATTFLLSGCGNTEKAKEKVGVQDNMVIENKGTPVENATLKVAFISDSPFTGIFHQAFADGNPDMEILVYSTNGTFNVDENYRLVNGGGADIEFKPEEKKVIVTIHEKYTWNDGTPVTSADFLEYYKIVAHKDYTGVRFDGDMRNVVGIEEYNKEESKEISGFKTLSDKKFEIHFKKFNPSILWGGGIPSEPVPSHKLKDIPVKEQQAHDITRKNPLSPGPYYIKEVIPGQQVVFEANPHYYRGQPKVKTVVWKIVPSAQIVAALQSGEYDLTVSLNSDLYSKVKALKNVQIAVKDELSYTYIGFKLGKWDTKKKEAVMDPNAKMADVKLRQAMAYAIDNDQVGEKFYEGLRRNATQLMIPAFKEYYDDSLKGYTLNIDKAKKLLDEAGYKDTNGDGIREDKNGKPFKIKFASMSGGAIAEPIANYYIQQWKKIGLDVELTTGRLIEFNSFYDKVKADDPEIDIYQAAWGTGSNPNPTGLYGRKAFFNFPRFATPELDAILDKINSYEAVDKEYRAKAYKEFANYMFENVPVVPTLFRKSIVAVNNRVKKWDITPGSNFSLFDVELTADAPIK